MTNQTISVKCSVCKISQMSWRKVICKFKLFCYNINFFFFFGCTGSSLLPVGFLQSWRVGVTLVCGSRASHCSGFSYCRAWALGCTGFSSCGAWAQQLCLAGSVVVARGLQSTGSVFEAHSLSCSTARGIFLGPGPNPCPLHCQADS